MNIDSQPKFIPTQYPAVRLLFGVAAGIILQLAVSWSSLGFAITAGLCVAIGVGCLIAKKYSVSFWLCSAAIGLWVGFHATALRVPSRSIGEITAVIDGEITSILRKDSTIVKCIIDGKIDAKALPAIEPCKVILTVSNPTVREHFLETGAHIYAVVSLRLPQLPSLPAEFNEVQYCVANDVQFMARANAAKVALLEKPNGLSWFVYSSISAVERAIHSLYPEEIGAIVSALVFGNQTGLTEETRRAFSLSGTAHVVSVSGFHVGIIAAGVFIVLGFIRNRWVKFVVFTVLITFFIIISGLQPAAMRAAIMAELAMIALILEQRIIGLNIVALALIFVVIYSPQVLFSPGFQMSAASILGISLLFNPFQRGLGMLLPKHLWVREIIITSLAVTFAASVMVSPLVAYYFSIFSVISPLANLLVIPLMSVAMIWAFCSLMVLHLNWGVATTFAAASAASIQLAELINTWAIKLPFAAVQSSQIAVLIAVVSSASLIYILLANSRMHALFRFCVASAVMVMSVMIAKPDIDINVAFSAGETIPIVARRMNVDATIIPLKKGVGVALITDRRAHQYPSGDAPLERYLSGLNDSLLIGIRGNSSEWIAAQVRNNHPKTRIFVCPVSFQNELGMAKKE